MKIFEATKLAHTLITEYNNSKANVDITGQGGDKAAGKNLDNIAVGKTEDYKDNSYETKYMAQFPNLGKMVADLKEMATPGDKLVSGPALQELQVLLQSFEPKQDGNDFIMPFGDNVRMSIRGENFFLSIKNAGDPEETQMTDAGVISQQASL